MEGERSEDAGEGGGHLGPGPDKSVSCICSKAGVQ